MREKIKLIIKPFCLFLIPFVSLNLIQTAPQQTSKQADKLVFESKTEKNLLLDLYESLEDFALLISGITPKLELQQRQLFQAKRNYEITKKIYDSSYWNEAFIYVIGFKWLWGIFIGYKSTYIAPSYRAFMAATEQLRYAEERFNQTKGSLKDVIFMLEQNLAKISPLSQLQESLALRRVRVKLTRIDSQLDQLIVAIETSLEYEKNFDEYILEGRNQTSSVSTQSASLYFPDSNSKNSTTFTQVSSTDIAARQIWDKTQSHRYQQESQRLKKEIEQAKAAFEDLTSITALREDIDSILKEISNKKTR